MSGGCRIAGKQAHDNELIAAGAIVKFELPREECGERRQPATLTLTLLDIHIHVHIYKCSNWMNETKNIDERL